MKKVVLFLFFVFLIKSFLIASVSKPLTSIPFETVGSYIVVKISINGSKSLNMIFDTGLRSTIISELSPSDSLPVTFSGVRELQGLGEGEPVRAFASYDNTIKAGKLKLQNRPVFVLEEDIFNLSRQTGKQINGLLGVDFFYDYIVQIDHSAKRLRFYEKEMTVFPKGYESMDMTIENRKMYIHLSVLETDTARRKIKMLIDTGAQLNAWFHNLKPESVKVPEKPVRGRIGQGISGEVYGTYARVTQICIAHFCVRNPIVVFPDSAAIAEIMLNSDRDGTIGSQLLNRFNLFIDYPNKKFHFKPNSTFNKSFTYNIAGIEIEQVLTFVSQAEVSRVWEGSPGEKAGVEVGDMILEINGQKTFNMPLGEQKSYFEKPSKLPLTLLVRRNGKEIMLKVNMISKI
jgi:hypothetical protein